MGKFLLDSQAEFPLFGSSHATAAALFCLLLVAAIATGRRASPGSTQGWLRWPLGLTIFLGEVAFAAYPLGDGTWSPDWALPLHFCDLTAFLALPALITLRPFLVEALFYCAFTGTFFAMATPELQHDFPHIEFLCFFATHALVVVAAAYLVWGLELRPRPGAWWRVWLAVNLYGVAIAGLNHRLNANYLFLCYKPQVASPFDYLGPWPGYVVALDLLLLGLMAGLARAVETRSIEV